MKFLSGSGETDLTQGVIWKQLIRFAAPLTIGVLFQQLYNAVDSVVVGQFVGSNALAAVGSVGSIINMLVGLCAGLSTGAGVVISQVYGAKDFRALHQAVQTAIAGTFILSIIATLIGLLLIDPLLQMMSTPDAVYPEAKTYTTVYFLGMVGLLTYNMGSGILRAVGDSRRPLIFLVISAVLNIALDLLFVLVFPMGVFGVALATVIAQAISAALVLYSLTGHHVPYGIQWQALRIHRPLLKRILSIGLPSGFQQAVTAFSNIFVWSYFYAFGPACVAGWNVHSKLDGFLMLPASAIAMATTTFVGQNWGAGNQERARKCTVQALALSGGITLVLVVLMLIFAKNLILLFSTDEDVIWYSIQFIIIVSPFYLLVIFNNTIVGVLRGIGNAKVPMFVMLGSFVVFRQIFLAVTSWLNAGFISVALAYPMGWAVCFLLLVYFYRRSPMWPGRTAAKQYAQGES